MKPEDVPYLPGIISASRAARILGVTKQTMTWRMFTRGDFAHIYKVDNGLDDGRPFYLLNEAEVRAVAQRDLDAVEAAEKARAAKRQTREYNRRVKQWALEQGHAQKFEPTGPVSPSILKLYEQAHT